MNTLRAATAILLMSAALGGAGCAAVPVAAALGGAFSAGAGAAVNAGKEYAKSGAVYRTFALPMDDLRLALSDVLARMELAIVSDEVDKDDRVIKAVAREREITLRLEPVTRTVSRVRVVVERGALFGKDLATATTIIERTERAAQTRIAELDRAYAVAASVRAPDASSAPPTASPSARPPDPSASPPTATGSARGTDASSASRAVRPARSPCAGR